MVYTLKQNILLYKFWDDETVHTNIFSKYNIFVCVLNCYLTNMFFGDES